MKKGLIIIAVPVFLAMIIAIWMNPPAPVTPIGVAATQPLVVQPTAAEKVVSESKFARAMDSVDTISNNTEKGVSQTLNTIAIVAVSVLGTFILIVILLVIQAGRTKLGFASVRDLNSGREVRFAGLVGDGSNEVPNGAFAAATAVEDAIVKREQDKVKRLPKSLDHFLED
jgi:hypothetical protein